MVFLADTFTDADDTALPSHAPDTGGVWEAMAFSTGGGGQTNLTATIIGNQIVASPDVTTGLSVVYRNTADPGEDQYDIQVTWSFGPSQSTRYHILCWRMTPTGTADGDVDRYMLLGNGSATQEWQLNKIVGGVMTLLDSAVASLAGDSFSVRVEVRTGSSTVYVDDVQTLTTSDTAITQRGRVGIGIGRRDTTHFVDDLTATAMVGGAAEPEVQLLSGWVEVDPAFPQVQILSGWMERDPDPGPAPVVQILSGWVERGPESPITEGAWWVRVDGVWVRHWAWARVDGVWV